MRFKLSEKWTKYSSADYWLQFSHWSYSLIDIFGKAPEKVILSREPQPPCRKCAKNPELVCLIFFLWMSGGDGGQSIKRNRKETSTAIPKCDFLFIPPCYDTFLVFSLRGKNIHNFCFGSAKREKAEWCVFPPSLLQRAAHSSRIPGTAWQAVSVTHFITPLPTTFPPPGRANDLKWKALFTLRLVWIYLPK